MKFNRLRIVGFKSFCDNTDFLIEPGLTGIVGPNGCGKSNLTEAMRWVMGENSYKNMRASGMDDVIFSGSGSRPARNTAEVGLVLDNSDRTAPAAFNDSDIIEVTRRIEREQGSVYRINGKEARARDVMLLFADASTGARSPAMVGQGRIGEIISAKPQQRRRILEEAAGIAGLHSRRHEAEHAGIRLGPMVAEHAHVFDADHAIKAAGQAQGVKHPQRIGARGIGQDVLATRQPAQRGSVVRAGAKARFQTRQPVGRLQKMRRPHAMVLDQPQHRGTVVLPVVLPQRAGRLVRHAEVIDDVLRHRHIGGRERRRARVVQGVVEIEQPDPIATGRFQCERIMVP